jgi:hypothetical protein
VEVTFVMPGLRPLAASLMAGGGAHALMADGRGQMADGGWQMAER